jgi:hypothetical protein
LETIVNDDNNDGASHSMRPASEDDLMDDFLNSMKEYESGDGLKSIGALDDLVGADASAGDACQELGNAQEAYASHYCMGGADCRSQPMCPPAYGAAQSNNFRAFMPPAAAASPMPPQPPAARWGRVQPTMPAQVMQQGP